MLTIKNILSAGAAKHYYRQESGLKSKDYYSEDNKIRNSSWWGRGAAELGLKGLVDQERFSKALAGQLPGGIDFSSKQRANSKSPAHRAGYDFTISAPKSISIAALVLGDKALIRAHDKAVNEALGHLERHAVYARKTVLRKTSAVQTGNLVVAKFTHETSREHDPQLHTHAVVVNATQRKDRKWRSLFNGALYKQQGLATAVYRSRLAVEARSLGYELRLGPRGTFEITGYTTRQLEQFSKRRAQIEDHLARSGQSGAAAAQKAAYETRRSKQLPDRSELLRSWQSEAKTVGLAPGLGMASEPCTPLEPHQVAAASREAVRWAISHLSERESILRVPDLLEHALERVVATATFADIESAFKRAIESEELLPVRIKKAPGQIEEPGYTTPELLRMETQCLTFMRRGQWSAEPILEREAIEQALTDKHLNKGQADAVKFALETRHRIVGIHGFAGVGKTRSLTSVRELAEGRGWIARALAPTGAAVRVLKQDAGLNAQTLCKHLARQRRDPGHTDGSRELWILDEASMVGTKQMRDLFLSAEAARKRGAEVRILLVGDKRQLSSIPAGCPFKLLIERGMPVARITEIKRQDPTRLKEKLGESDLDETEKQRQIEQAKALRVAVEHLAHGRPANQALECLARVKQTHQIQDREERLGAIVKEYLSRDPATRRETLLVTSLREDRAKLNQLVREGLKKLGDLAGEEIRAQVLVSKDLTKAEVKHIGSYAPLDVLRFATAQRKHRIEPGEYLQVQSVHPERGVVALKRLGKQDEQTILWKPGKTTRIEVFELGSRALAHGDTIRWTRSSEQGHVNGERATVLKVNRGKATATVQDREGARHVLNLKTDRHWDHAYATTTQSAQGASKDYAIIHLPAAAHKSVGHEALYVAAARARYGATIYTDDSAALERLVKNTMGQESALLLREAYLYGGKASQRVSLW